MCLANVRHDPNIVDKNPPALAGGPSANAQQVLLYGATSWARILRAGNGIHLGGWNFRIGQVPDRCLVQHKLGYWLFSLFFHGLSFRVPRMEVRCLKLDTACSDACFRRREPRGPLAVLHRQVFATCMWRPTIAKRPSQRDIKVIVTSYAHGHCVGWQRGSNTVVVSFAALLTSFLVRFLTVAWFRTSLANGCSVRFLTSGV
jgi:hypothetical protein